MKPRAEACGTTEPGKRDHPGATGRRPRLKMWHGQHAKGSDKSGVVTAEDGRCRSEWFIAATELLQWALARWKQFDF